MALEPEFWQNARVAGISGANAGFLGALAGGLLAVSAVFGAGPDDPKHRIYSNGPTTWIYHEPARSPHPFGSIRAGTWLTVRDPDPVKGPGCAGAGFVAVEPAGFVCLDENAVRDKASRYSRAMKRAAPLAGVLPYHYALSNGAPMYQRLPTREEWEATEAALGAPGTYQPLSRWQRGHEELAVARTLVPKEELPWFLKSGGSVSSAAPRAALRRFIPAGSMVAYTEVFAHAGRTWLLSSDGTIVPADRVRPFRVSNFAGVRPTGRLRLPLAFTRSEGATRYFRSSEGAFRVAGGAWPARSPLPLVDPVEGVWWKSTLYLPTTESARGQGLWVRNDDVRVVEARRVPAGVRPGEKWLRFSITGGTLVAYRGREPVYVTLASPGIGGVPRAEEDLVKASKTPLGRFRITYKHRARDMSPEQGEKRKFWIAEVPDTQYFQPPFAIHTAYWHESFGEPMSGGCINVSPRDGRFLFRFTDPQLPRGFTGVGAGGSLGHGTVLIVVR